MAPFRFPELAAALPGMQQYFSLLGMKIRRRAARRLTRINNQRMTRHVA